MSKENKVERAVTDNKLSKYGFTRKTFYSISSMFICLALIIVLSVTQATFNSESLKTTTFWVEFTVLAGLCIYGMISGQQTGDNMARNSSEGVFRVSLGKYATTFSKIDALFLFAYFDEWVDWYRERKLKRKIERLLKDNGIHQMDVLDLDLLEVDKLTAPFMKKTKSGKELYFLTYTLEQIELIKFCKTGGVKVSELPSSFFLSALNQSEKDMWESAARSGRKKAAYLGASYVYRIIALLAMSILSSGLAPGEMTTISAVILSLAKRVFCVSTAFIWGVFVGFEIVKIDVTYLDFKTDVLNQYYQECELKIYTPKTMEEKAKEIYEKTVGSLKEDDDSGGESATENRKE